MSKINILPFSVANLIAAGEVVDRPASVVKELMENAIDAGATSITVEIQHGGVTFLRVTDNGCGMEPEELPVSICRHATSKIKDAEDLDGIITLGFRGEALAAIAAVSEMRIVSKVKDAEFGACLEVRGGEILGLHEQGCSNGTSVIVENLFFNVPARRKFLKRDATEAMAVGANVEKVALSHPEIAVRLISDGTIRLETSGDGILKNTVYAVFGRDFASRMLYVEGGSDGIRVTGCIGRSDNAKANRNFQNFFLNGRYVRSKTAVAAVEQAYVSYLPPEKFPACVLYLTLNPSAVDVNVHPAKLEVKFSNEKPVFEAIYYTVRSALEENKTRPEVLIPTAKTVSPPIRMSAEEYRKQQDRYSPKRVSDAFVPIDDRMVSEKKPEQIRIGDFYQQTESRPASPTGIPAKQPTVRGEKEITPERNTKRLQEKFPEKIPEKIPEKFPEKIPESKKAPEVLSPFKEHPLPPDAPPPLCPLEEKPGKEPEEPKEKSNPEPLENRPPVLPAYRIVGEVFHSYVLVEKDDVLLLVDKHAAHERIIFEHLKAGMRAGLKGEQISQLLMLPIEFMLTSSEIQLLLLYRKEIEEIGFAFETGVHTVRVTAIPDGIAPDAVGDMFGVMVSRLGDSTGNAALTRDIVFEKALYQASCKAAIKAGREYTDAHIEWIIAKLMELPDITFCPHGRPVALEMSHKMLDHQFHRI